MVPMMKFISLYKQGIFLSFLTGISYLLGYLRDKIFAHYYGLSTTLDIYNASFVIPDTVMNLFLAGAMVSVLVPFMNKYDQDDQKDMYLNAILEIGLILNIIVCTLLYFMMPAIVPVVVQKKELIEPVILYSRVLLLSPIIFFMSNFLGGILVKNRNLIFYGLSPILYNIGIIGGVILLHAYGILGIILGALVGAVLHTSIRWTGVVLQKEKVRFMIVHFVHRWKEIANSFQEFFRLALPKMISLTTLHINYWLFTYYASQSHTEGSIFALNICKNFYNVPISIIAIALATDAFAQLSTSFAEQNGTCFQRTFKKYFLVIGVSGGIFGLIYFFFAPLLISMLFKGGKFDQEAVLFTGTLLSYFGLVIIFESIMQYLARVLHAMQDTFWQMISQLSCFIITSALLFFIFPSIGIIAIPISFSIGMFGQNIIQGCVIWRKTKSIDTARQAALY
jgi:putative peptidoglycan lipid II flippase